MKLTQLYQLIREEIKASQNPPEISNKIQQYIKNGSKGDLNLSESKIKSFENLKRIEGNLNLMLSRQIKSLGNLEYIGGELDFSYSGLQTLGNLEYVGGDAYLSNTSIKDLGNLKYIGGSLFLVTSKIQSFGNLKKVKGNIILFASPDAKKFTEEEIRQQIDVGGNLILKGRGE